MTLTMLDRTVLLWLKFRGAGPLKQAAVLCLPVVVFWLLWMVLGHEVPILRIVPFDSKGWHGPKETFWTLPIPTSGWWLAIIGLAWPLCFEPVIHYYERRSASRWDNEFEFFVGLGFGLGVIGGFMSYMGAPICVAIPMLMCGLRLISNWDNPDHVKKEDMVDEQVMFVFVALGAFMTGPTFGIIITLLLIPAFLIPLMLLPFRRIYVRAFGYGQPDDGW